MATNRITKGLNVHYQIERNGPFLNTRVEIRLGDFINAKSPHKYIKDLVELGNMGSTVISVDFNYTQEQAKIDLDNLLKSKGE